MRIWNMTATEDHPRVCGEHSSRMGEADSDGGSSPRMRGAQVPSVGLRVPHGIIPAYAGSTPCPGSSVTCRRDHPRVCGEHKAVSAHAQRCMGSSPRMRGALSSARRGRICPGIIPAYAGSTHLVTFPRYSTQDHPRVCGEHADLAELAVVEAGSSPRMRGAQGAWGTPVCHAGIIPAYAGSTIPGQKYPKRTGDHPRVCGEHLKPVMQLISQVGIIPAYAGSTPTRWLSTRCSRDHPRVCGEHSR